MPQLGPEIWHGTHDKKQPKRIGEHQVAVPDRFFKVVLIYNRKSPIAMGFLFDNKAHHQALDKYMVSVDSVEKVTGMDFFSKLPDNVENRIFRHCLQEGEGRPELRFTPVVPRFCILQYKNDLSCNAKNQSSCGKL